VALDIRSHDRVGEPGDLAHDALVHALLIAADRRGELGCLLIADLDGKRSSAVYVAISSASAAHASLAFLSTFSSPPDPRRRSNGVLLRSEQGSG
jgi:hypothetical protein